MDAEREAEAGDGREIPCTGAAVGSSQSCGDGDLSQAAITWTALLVFVLTLAVYVATLHTTVCGGDNGELMAMVRSMHHRPAPLLGPDARSDPGVPTWRCAPARLSTAHDARQRLAPSHDGLRRAACLESSGQTRPLGEYLWRDVCSASCRGGGDVHLLVLCWRVCCRDVCLFGHSLEVQHAFRSVCTQQPLLCAAALFEHQIPVVRQQLGPLRRRRRVRAGAHKSAHRGAARGAPHSQCHCGVGRRPAAPQAPPGLDVFVLPGTSAVHLPADGEQRGSNGKLGGAR